MNYIADNSFYQQSTRYQWQPDYLYRYPLDGPANKILVRLVYNVISLFGQVCPATQSDLRLKFYLSFKLMIFHTVWRYQKYQITSEASSKLRAVSGTSCTDARLHKLNSVQKLCGTGFSQFLLLYVILGPTSPWESYSCRPPLISPAGF